MSDSDQKEPEDQKQDLLRQLRMDPQHRPQRAARAWGRIIAALVALALLVAGSLLYVSMRARPIVVPAAAATRSSGQPTAASARQASAALQASGYVTARREATVSAQITGALVAVPIQEGEHVVKGQVLARLDDAAQQAAVAKSRAQLQATQALLAQYQAQLKEALLENRRNAVLIRQNSVSQQTYDQSRAQVAELQAQLEAQRGQIALARATLQSAEVQLAYTVVRAPFAGVLIQKNAQVGEIISPLSAGGSFTRTGVATIVDMSTLEIDVDVDESYIDRVHPMQRAVAVLDAYPNWMIPAHVIAIIPTADKSKGTVTVRIAIDRRDPRILPDMGAHVTFLGGSPVTHHRRGRASASGHAQPPPAKVHEQDRDRRRRHSRQA